jgi:hypothetical protein
VPLVFSVRQRIAEIPVEDWRPCSYREGSQVASVEWRPTTWEKARRFVIRRDPLEQGGQLTLEGRELALLGAGHERWRALGRRARVLAPGQGQRRKPDPGGEARPRARQPPLPRLPRQLGAYLLCTLIAYNLLTWLKLLALPEGERGSYAKRLRFRFIAVAGTVGRSGRRLLPRLSAGYALLGDFLRALEQIRGLARAPA